MVHPGLALVSKQNQEGKRKLLGEPGDAPWQRCCAPTPSPRSPGLGICFTPAGGKVQKPSLREPCPKTPSQDAVFVAMLEVKGSLRLLKIL